MLMSSAFLSHHGTGRNEGSGHTVTVVQELRRRREHCIAPFSPLRSSQVVRRSAVWTKSCSRISLSTPPFAHVALLDSY